MLFVLSCKVWNEVQKKDKLIRRAANNDKWRRSHFHRHLDGDFWIKFFRTVLTVGNWKRWNEKRRGILLHMYACLRDSTVIVFVQKRIVPSNNGECITVYVLASQCLRLSNDNVWISRSVWLVYPQIVTVMLGNLAASGTSFRFFQFKFYWLILFGGIQVGETATESSIGKQARHAKMTNDLKLKLSSHPPPLYKNTKGGAGRRESEQRAWEGSRTKRPLYFMSCHISK